ncbi:MAG: hypothetical protein ABIY51_15290 [Ferruginibacter sp.]
MNCLNVFTQTIYEYFDNGDKDWTKVVLKPGKTKTKSKKTSEKKAARQTNVTNSFIDDPLASILSKDFLSGISKGLITK